MSSTDAFVDFVFVAFLFGLPALFLVGLVVLVGVTAVAAVVEWFAKRRGARVCSGCASGGNR